jgi:hypothetical protein
MQDQNPTVTINTVLAFPICWVQDHNFQSWYKKRLLLTQPDDDLPYFVYDEETYDASWYKEISFTDPNTPKQIESTLDYLEANLADYSSNQQVADLSDYYKELERTEAMLFHGEGLPEITQLLIDTMKTKILILEAKLLKQTLNLV